MARRSPNLETARERLDGYRPPVGDIGDARDLAEAALDQAEANQAETDQAETETDKTAAEAAPIPDRAWSRRNPELASVANAVSLAMPYLEPYVVRSVRRATENIPPELRDEAREYLRQEAAHAAAHRRFNDALREQWPVLSYVESGLAWSTRKLGQRSGVRFHTGFAAGFEAVAYEVARWFAPRAEKLLFESDSESARLFVWHLAEEVEHRGVALDVHRAVGGRRATYGLGLLISFVLLGLSTWFATVLLIVEQRRAFRPIAWWRLIGWALSFLLTSGPWLLLSFQRSHHPSQQDDLPQLRRWLAANPIVQERP